MLFFSSRLAFIARKVKSKAYKSCQSNGDLHTHRSLWDSDHSGTLTTAHCGTLTAGPCESATAARPRAPLRPCGASWRTPLGPVAHAALPHGTHTSRPAEGIFGRRLTRAMTERPPLMMMVWHDARAHSLIRVQISHPSPGPFPGLARDEDSESAYSGWKKKGTSKYPGSRLKRRVTAARARLDPGIGWHRPYSERPSQSRRRRPPPLVWRSALFPCCPESAESCGRIRPGTRCIETVSRVRAPYAQCRGQLGSGRRSGTPLFVYFLVHKCPTGASPKPDVSFDRAGPVGYCGDWHWQSHWVPMVMIIGGHSA